jgi:hypothetical protein
LQRSKMLRVAGLGAAASLVLASGAAVADEHDTTPPAAVEDGAVTDPEEGDDTDDLDEDVEEDVEEEGVTEDDDVTGEEGQDDGEASNHGQTVSTFARTTDLEGREKGQAIAELASSKSQDEEVDAEGSTGESSEDESPEGPDEARDSDDVEDPPADGADEASAGTDDGADADGPRNHGQKVSETARDNDRGPGASERGSGDEAA